MPERSSGSSDTIQMPCEGVENMSIRTLSELFLVVAQLRSGSLPDAQGGRPLRRRFDRRTGAPGPADRQGAGRQRHPAGRPRRAHGRERAALAGRRLRDPLHRRGAGADLPHPASRGRGLRRPRQRLAGPLRAGAGAARRPARRARRDARRRADRRDSPGSGPGESRASRTRPESRPSRTSWRAAPEPTRPGSSRWPRTPSPRTWRRSSTPAARPATRRASC